ncbi:uncharacterized protein BDZ99DRAFT_190491 [Mytilinidion resinicola]|uniref:C2H2-type domain-containing protein n=1 Tax=Mytilinidion resinicola TaxID=574789 RepID=A0A6A6Z270_9PEZI|nr:uncharacterized protein BDZ99DRAFT_190491 [Mytilinidion resinicola]KAF2815100.1 hypothetical protein BDZ99DRAFT_190491 [Mytilinidion resinicola]
MSNYDSDDAFPRSPGLKPIRPKATPSPSPPPFIPQQNRTIPSPENVSPSSQKKRKKPNRRKTRPIQGDTVLVSFMDPNRPDIARLVGEQALNSDSGSEADEEDMEDIVNQSPPADSAHQTAGTPSGLDLVGTAQAALQTADSRGPKDTRTSPPRREPVKSGSGEFAEPPFRPMSESVNEASTQYPSAGVLTNGGQAHANGAGSASDRKFEATSPKLTGERLSPLANGYPHEDSLATSPNLRELTIPQSKGSPRQTLPALQNPSSPSRDGPNSPNHNQKLPSFRQLSELAEAASNEQLEARANGYPHRHSFSSTGQSPTLVSRHYSTSSIQRSPPTPFPPLSATSPISAHSDISSSQDLFLRSGQSHQYFFNRRPSQASDNGPPYGSNLPLSASTADSYPSSDSFSPGSTDHGHRMSIDEAVNNHRTLPPPTGPHIQHIPPHGASGFKCDHPGCTAPPFQTQYLLNSHANVHSQTRPHFCPVHGCPRAEGGKGFKRKNEMIRHGLVHASPGYVCPFCPDREHKYPRPDNLQRHVRVHHVDKDKDDPQLREVLAQRLEGGSRGRRRRAGSG